MVPSLNFRWHHDVFRKDHSHSVGGVLDSMDEVVGTLRDLENARGTMAASAAQGRRSGVIAGAGDARAVDLAGSLAGRRRTPVGSFAFIAYSSLLEFLMPFPSSFCLG